MKKMNLIIAGLIFMSCSANTLEKENSISVKEKINDSFSEDEAEDLAEILAKNVADTNIIDEYVIIGEKDESIQKETSSNSESIEMVEETVETEAIPSPTITEEVIEEQETIVPVVDFQEYASFTSFLKSHVSSSGKVNYAKIKTDISQLNAIIKTFEENYPTSSWTRNEVLVYWINAYNLYTLKLVASNYPVSSIKDITVKPWHKKFIKLGGATISLNDIEHSKIRAKYNEPRIHFALNCASKSCPVLLNKAFTTKSLYYLLTAQTKKFLNDATKNNFSNPKSIKISSLFDWYSGDFAKKEGSVIDFINKYRTEQLKNPKIGYLEYSWKLNN